MKLNQLIHGDCLKEMENISNNTIDLVITSPPYADSRKQTYGGIKPDDYVEWFLPIAKQLHRVLKKDGTFILNIREKAVNGERHTYVLELILRMRKELGWLWTEEFIWHKKNCYPGKWPNRFRNAWERILQFNKNRSFRMYQDAVKVPIGKWSKNRLKNLSEKDKVRIVSDVGSGFGKNVSNWLEKKEVYPTNVITLATECSNRKHSAVFPEGIPDWFIRLFTVEEDWVLDPFMGSGTTNIVAQRLNRNSIGIEIVKDYVEIAKRRLETC